MLSCFVCLNCGKNNPIKGNSYTNKYCNNSCQQQHRSRSLVDQWKDHQGQTAWRQVPAYIKNYLIEQRGHRCQVCDGEKHNGKDIPLIVEYLDANSHNNVESNLQLICPNCRAQK